MISGFYRLSPMERRQTLCRAGFISENDLERMASADMPADFDLMIENCIGAFRLPIGVLTGICVNGREHPVAMATEEPSIIAGISRAARVFNAAGGVHVSVAAPVTSAQAMFVIPPRNARQFCRYLHLHASRWFKIANACDPELCAHGGGAFQIHTDILPQSREWSETFAVLTIDVHTADAMGANAVNAMAEALLHDIPNWCSKDGEHFKPVPGMAILSNEGSGRLVSASIALHAHDLTSLFHGDPSKILHCIARSSAFAQRSPNRAVTHNKGILNGIIAAALPLGQDTRAISAAAMMHAAQSSKIKPLSHWKCTQNGLLGSISIPLPVGFIGGSKPQFEAAFRFDRIDAYSTLCAVLCAVGLAQNFAALWALSTDGIQAGHMKLHRRKL